MLNLTMPGRSRKPINWPSVAIALFSGLGMSLATAPLSLWGLAWLALVPLWILAIVGSTSGKLTVPLLLPLVWGIAYHGSALHWLKGLHPLTWLGVPWLASVAIVAAAWAIITLWGTGFVCLWFWLMRWLGHGQVRPIVRVLVGTVAWCALETLRQISPLDWTSLSYTQSPHNLSILHLGQISGPMTVTAAIVMVNGCLAEAWVARAELRSAQLQRRYLSFALLSVLLCHGIGWGLWRQPLVDSPESALKVGLIQGNVPTRIKLFANGLQQAIQGYAEGYRSLADQGVQVVLTPEGALPFLWHERNRQQNLVYRSVLERKIPLWLGTFMPEGNRYTQSLITVAPTGETLSRFNKIKLVPLGEYLPFEDSLGKLIGRLSPIRAFMVPGRTDQRFDTPFGRAAVSICYEAAFADLMRSQVAAGAEFLITASNLDPYSTVLMAQHQAHDLMRSIETDRWAVRVTNTGYSSVIDPHGQIRWQSQPHTYSLHADTLHRRRTQTLYTRWGNWLTPTLCALAVMVLLIDLKKQSIDRS